MAIFTGIFISSIKIKGNSVIRFFLILFILSVIFLQSAQTYVWLKLKTDSDVRADSSEWTKGNIRPNTVIGLENIPIYQKIPDILLKDFYLNEYSQGNNATYKYMIIDSRSRNLPKVLVLTDMDVEYEYLIKSDKNNLTDRLIKAGYRKVKVFEPNLKYYYFTGDQLSFYLSGLIPIPTSIAVYQKIY
jgi:hypothetical protein